MNRFGEWLENSVSVDGHLAVLSDLDAPVAVSADGTDQMGISKLFLKGLHAGSCVAILNPVLRVCLNTGNDWGPVAVTNRTAWPWGWREIGETEAATVLQDVWFGGNGHLCIWWQVTSKQGNDETPRLAFWGAFPGESVTISDKGEASTYEWDLRFEMVNALVKLPYQIDFSLSLNASFLDPTELVLPEMGVRDGGQTFAAEVAVENGTTDASLNWNFDPLSLTPSPQSRTLAEAEACWHGWLNRLPECEPNNWFWQRKRIRAAHDIVGASVRAPGYGNFSEKMGALASPINWSSTAFFWDSMIALPTLGMFEPEWAAEVIESFTDHAHPGSLPPSFVNAFPLIPGNRRFQECYAPTASWAICKLWKCGGVDTILERIYPSLKKLHERWFEVADHDRDGIPEWRNAGCPAHNSPLYDRYAPFGSVAKGIGCHNLLPHRSVSLCSYLLMDMRCLESIATKLGYSEDAEIWNSRGKWLSGQIMEHLWSADDLIFHDRDTTTGEASQVKTFFSLLPLWAGVDMPEELARDAIERHLLNPKEFWGKVPFPSVAYDEETYDASGYWRGRTWPHVYFWNVEILSKYGYHAEAEEAKKRFLSVVATGKEVAENYPTDWSIIGQSGMPHYAFGTGALVHFLQKWHVKPL